MRAELYRELMAFANRNEPFSVLNHLRVTHLDEGEATVELTLCADSLNRWGIPHGGVLFAMADLAAGMACLTLRQEMCVTLSAGIEFISAAAFPGHLRATGRVRRLGNRVAFCATDVLDEDDNLIASLTASMYFTGQPLTS